METMAHSDFKCLIRKCSMETLLCPITFLDLGDTSKYNECQSASAVSLKIL